MRFISYKKALWSRMKHCYQIFISVWCLPGQGGIQYGQATSFNTLNHQTMKMLRFTSPLRSDHQDYAHYNLLVV